MIYRIIGMAVLAVGLALIPFLGNLVKDQQLPGGLSLTLSYLIFLADSAISYLLYGYMTAIPTAFQRRDILSRIDMCAACSLILCDRLLPQSMAMSGGPAACAVCLAGRLIICSLTAAAVFWAIWHRSERCAGAVKWLRRSL